jgi:hypothetical protein
MAVLYKPYTDPSRVYFGTDTRASTMLIGAALAIIWTPWRLTRDTGKRAPLVLDIMAAVGFAGVVWFFLNAGEFDNWMYRGGFLVMALFSALLIAATVHPASRLSPKVFGVTPLLWIGVRSYGIYLWHWPVFMVTRPHSDIPLTGIPLLALRLAITLVLAMLSYKFVEEPIRHGALGRWIRSVRAATGERRRQLRTTFAVSGGVALVGLVVVGIWLANAEPAARPDQFPSSGSVVYRPTTTTAPGLPQLPSTTAAPGAAPAALPPGFGTEPSTTAAPSTTGAQPGAGAPVAAPAPPGVGPRVTAIGDSVMLGAATQLADTIGPDRVTVDAAESRQFSAGVDTIQQYHDDGELGSDVVVQLGTNGTINPDDFNRMMDMLKGRKVILLNAKVPRPWEDQVNSTLADGASRYNATLIDWHNIASQHPEFFWDDGIHLRPEGAQFYAQLIAGYVNP